MKKILFLSALIFACSIGVSKAQLEEGNVLIGAQLANIDFGFGSGNSFSINLSPQVGYFIEDNIAVGGLFNLGYQTARVSGSSKGNNIFNYAINGFGRYYFNPGEKGINNLLNHGRFFAEANAGIAGSTGNAIGLNIGFGPGYAYFITPNVALETLVKYNGNFGDGAKSGLGLNLGFKIHLPSGKLKQMRDNPGSL